MASKARFPTAVRRTRCARRSRAEVVRVTSPSFTSRVVRPVRFPLLTRSRRASSPMVSPSRDSRAAMSSCASMSKRGSVLEKSSRKRPRTRDSIKFVQVSRRSQMRSGVAAWFSRCALLLTSCRLFLEIALELFFAGEVLNRPGLLFVALLGGSVQRPMWIAQVRARQRAKIRTARGNDAVYLIRFRDVPDCDRRHASLVADAIAVRRLIHASVDRLGVFRSLPGRNVNDVATGADECAGDLDGIVAADSAFDPIGCGDTHRDRLPLGPSGPHRSENFDWKA